jgi:hypothetical protein
MNEAKKAALIAVFRGSGVSNLLRLIRLRYGESRRNDGNHI